jgi:hypothetical protein
MDSGACRRSVAGSTNNKKAPNGAFFLVESTLFSASKYLRLARFLTQANRITIKNLLSTKTIYRVIVN